MIDKYFTLLFLLILLYSSKLKAQTINLDSIDISFSKKLIKRVGVNNEDKLLIDAASILDNHINLNLNWKAFKYEEEINWNVNPYNNVSWLNYLYSLRMLAVLSEAYEINLNKEYLFKGKELLFSWNENRKQIQFLKDKGKFIWNDHAVANRVINLVHFAYVLKKNGELDENSKKIILNQLIESGNWLYDDRNYTDGNHAIMMDRALLYLGYSLTDYKDSSIWIDKAKNRFNKIIDSEVTKEGVSVENSPQYHSFIMDLLKDFIEVIENAEDNPPKKYLDLFENMKSYLVYVLQPNLIYPFQGDTYPLSVPLNYSKKYDDPRLNFVESKGSMGVEPDRVDVIYKEAGYAILREKWGKPSDFEKSTYMNFICGVPSRIHKHSDNLSFSLYSNEEDIFIDPGSWGYAKNDTVSYLASTKAHNTFTINDENIRNFPVKSSKLIKYVLDSAYSYVEAEFTPNPFEKFIRKIVFIKPNIILLDDYVTSQKGINSVEQIFNLGGTVKNVLFKDNSIQAKFKNSTVLINQLKSNNYNISSYSGEVNIRGVYALRAEQTINGNQIVFKAKNDSTLSYFNNKSLIKILSNKKTSINNVDIKENPNDYQVEWQDSKGKDHSLTIETPHYIDVFNENIKKANCYDISNPNIEADFGIDNFHLLQWADTEYTVLFKLSENTTLEGLKKMTIGLKAYAKKEDLELLSNYAKKSNRNFDAWNIRENEIIKTNQGNFVYLNISTKLKSTEKFKIFLFDRKGYVKELWNHTIDNLYFDKFTKNLELKNSIENGIVISEFSNLSDQISLEKIIVNRINKEDLNIYLKLSKTSTKEDLTKYKIGFHTYVEDSSLDSLTNYSKSKNRNYDAWDFIPEITVIDGNHYIIKKIKTSINKFTKVKLFLYDRSGYNGLIGNNLVIDSVEIK